MIFLNISEKSDSARKFIIYLIYKSVDGQYI